LSNHILCERLANHALFWAAREHEPTAVSQGAWRHHLQGTELIPQLGNGDVITGVRLTRGGERLVNAPATIMERAMKASVMYGMP
jgi:hypothetical protein